MEHNTPTVPMQGMITSADEAEPARTLRCLINDPATAENIYQWLVGSGWFEQSQHGRTFRAHEALDRQQAALDNARAVLDNIDNRYAAAGPGNADFHHNRTYTDSQSDYQSRVGFDSRAPHSPSASTDVLSEIEVQQENNAPQRYAARGRYDDYERDHPPCSTTSFSRQHEPFVGEPAIHRSGQTSHVSSRNGVPYENNVSDTQTNRAYIQPAAQYYTGKRSAFPQEGRRYGSREQSPYSRTQQVDYVESEHHQESSHTYPAASNSYNQHRRSSVATTLASANYRPRHDNYDEYEPAPHPHDGRRNGRSRSPERHHIPARESYGSYRERDPRYSPAPVSAPIPAPYTPVTTEAVANAGRDHASNTAAHHDGANRAAAAAPTAGKQAGPNQPQDRDPQQERENLMAPLSFDAGQPGKTRFFVLRSYNYANIYQAQKSGIWATQKINEDVFVDAFRVCANVVFFFGVNTGPFYGYAKMRTLPSVSIPQPTWYRNLKMPATDPFEIEWLSTAPCERHHVGHLRNTLNDDLPVTRSRDGQEISEAAGLEMIRIMGREARKMMNGGVFGPA